MIQDSESRHSQVSSDIAREKLLQAELDIHMEQTARERLEQDMQIERDSRERAEAERDRERAIRQDHDTEIASLKTARDRLDVQLKEQKEKRLQVESQLESALIAKQSVEQELENQTRLRHEAEAAREQMHEGVGKEKLSRLEAEAHVERERVERQEVQRRLEKEATALQDSQTAHNDLLAQLHAERDQRARAEAELEDERCAKSDVEKKLADETVAREKAEAERDQERAERDVWERARRDVGDVQAELEHEREKIKYMQDAANEELGQMVEERQHLLLRIGQLEELLEVSHDQQGVIMEKLQTEVCVVDNVCTALDVERETVMMLQRRLQDMERERDVERVQSSKLATDIAICRESLIILESAIETEENKCADVKNQLTAQQEKNKILENDITEQTAQIVALERLLQDQRAEHAQMQADTSAQTRDLAAVESGLSAAHRDIARLEAEVAVAVGKTASFEREAAAADETCMLRIQEILRGNAELAAEKEAALERYAELETTLDTINTKMTWLESENFAGDTRVAGMKSDLAACQAECAEKEKQLQARLRETESDFTGKLLAAHTELTACRMRITALENQSIDSDKHIQGLEKQLDAARGQSRAADEGLAGIYEHVVCICTELQHVCIDWSMNTASHAQLQHDMFVLRAEYDALSVKYERVTREMSIVTGDLASSQHESEHVRTLLQAAEDQVTRVESMCESLKVEVQQACEAHKHVQRNSESLAKELACAHTELESISAERDAVSSTLKSVRSELDTERLEWTAVFDSLRVAGATDTLTQIMHNKRLASQLVTYKVQHMLKSYFVPWQLLCEASRMSSFNIMRRTFDQFAHNCDRNFHTQRIAHRIRHSTYMRVCRHALARWWFAIAEPVRVPVAFDHSRATPKGPVKPIAKASPSHECKRQHHDDHSYADPHEEDATLARAHSFPKNPRAITESASHAETTQLDSESSSDSSLSQDVYDLVQVHIPRLEQVLRRNADSRALMRRLYLRGAYLALDASMYSLPLLRTVTTISQRHANQACRRLLHLWAYRAHMRRRSTKAIMRKHNACQRACMEAWAAVCVKRAHVQRQGLKGNVRKHRACQQACMSAWAAICLKRARLTARGGTLKTRTYLRCLRRTFTAWFVLREARIAEHCMSVQTWRDVADLTSMRQNDIAKKVVGFWRMRADVKGMRSWKEDHEALAGISLRCVHSCVCTCVCVCVCVERHVYN